METFSSCEVPATQFGWSSFPEKPAWPLFQTKPHISNSSAIAFLMQPDRLASKALQSRRSRSLREEMGKKHNSTLSQITSAFSSGSGLKAEAGNTTGKHQWSVSAFFLYGYSKSNILVKSPAHCLLWRQKYPTYLSIKGWICPTRVQRQMSCPKSDILITENNYCSECR